MDPFVKLLVAACGSYLLGAIPSSYIMGRLLRGIDLREHGSGNLGAANTFRVLGVRAALPVLLFDVGKGFAAVYFSGLFAGRLPAVAIVSALAVVLGHSYSLFVRFSGGKGVGTTAGAFLALAPSAMALCVALWIAVLLTTRIVSVASIAGAVFLPLSVPLANRLFGAGAHYSITILAAIAAIFVLAKHRSNMRRLREGTEKRIF